METVRLAVIFSALFVVVSSYSIHIRPSILLENYYPSNSYLRIDAVTMNPKGSYIIGSSSSSPSGSYLLAIGSDSTLLFNTTYPRPSSDPYWKNIWATNDTIYTCGLGDSISTRYMLRIDDSNFTGSQIWKTLPHNASSLTSSEGAYCSLTSDSILYTSHISSSENTVGIVSITGGAILQNTNISLPGNHYTVAIAQNPNGKYALAGVGTVNSSKLIFYATYDFSTKLVENLTYYNASPSENFHATDFNTDITILPFASGNVFVYKFSVSGQMYCAIRKVSPEGISESTRIFKTRNDSYYAAVNYDSYIALTYYQPDTGSGMLVLVDTDLGVVQQLIVPDYPPNNVVLALNMFVYSTKETLVITSSYNKHVNIYWIVKQDLCSGSYAFDDNYACTACDSTCQYCTLPHDSHACSSCAPGLLPNVKYNFGTSCSIDGTASSTLSCVRSFVLGTQSIMQTVGWYELTAVGFDLNFNRDISAACSGTNFTSLLHTTSGADIDITSQLSFINSTSLKFTLPRTMTESKCSQYSDQTSKTSQCTLYLNMIETSTQYIGATYRIIYSVIYNLMTNSVSNSITIKSSDNNTIPVIPVIPNICSDDSCIIYGPKPSYSMGDNVTIVHVPTLKTIHLISVAAIEATFTSDNTTKDAMNYLLSQQNKSDGNLTTKIQLLDSSPQPIIVTFYLYTQYVEPRRLLIPNITGNYTTSSYSFTVIGATISDDCSTQPLGCLQGLWIALIVIGIVLIVGGAGLWIYCYIKKRREAREEEGKYADKPPKRSVMKSEEEEPKANGSEGERIRRGRLEEIKDEERKVSEEAQPKNKGENQLPVSPKEVKLEGL